MVKLNICRFFKKKLTFWEPKKNHVASVKILEVVTRPLV